MKILSIVALLLLSLLSSTSLLPAVSGADEPLNQPITINVQQEFQTIHSFGASDCWSAKFIGKWQDEPKKNQIADLLFSQDTLTNGQPKGIGLSLWRMNIGAGSFEQQDSSYIRDEWRREECFLTPDGRYDWSKQAGNQWFLAEARQRGVRYTLGFTNSPPVQMTRNGKAFSPGGKAFNLKTNAQYAFADFLTTVADHFKFDYLSPINEPQWDWAAGKNGKANQEGSPAENADILAVAKAVTSQLAAKRSKTTVVIGEAGQLNYLYEQAQSGRGTQLDYFFGSTQSGSFAKLPNVEPIWTYHSYFTTCRDSALVASRQRVAQRAKLVGNPPLWQSEFGVLGDICGQYNGSPRHTDMEYGLYVAKVIHHDLTLANATSWQWWLAINPYNYSDGLVYINAPDGSFNAHDKARHDGQVVDSRQLWAFGNFSRFIRPGMKRIAVKIGEKTNPVAEASRYMVSAYTDSGRRQLVLVCVNMTANTTDLPLKGVTIKGGHFVRYETTQHKSLAKSIVSAKRIQLEPKSVTTLVGYYR
ncbi:glycoside hydrolase [Spirosoma gilvum]